MCEKKDDILSKDNKSTLCAGKKTCKQKKSKIVIDLRISVFKN